MDRQTEGVAIHTTQELGVTGQPLVIKGVERIEAIILQRPELRMDVEINTHIFSRIVRRDFNLTSVKLFWYTKAYDRRNMAQALLQDLADEAQALEDMARRYKMPTERKVAATCQFRIISDESELLLRALMQADRALHKLMHSELAEVAEDNLGPFHRSLTALRRKVFGFYGAQRLSHFAPGPDAD